LTINKVFITGISGFTGRYVEKEYLDLGYEVYGCGTYVDINNPRHIKVDLNDIENLKLLLIELKPDVVIHLAGISFVAHQDKQRIYSTNVIGTFNLLTAIYEAQIRVSSIVLASSANVYGAADLLAVDESQPYAPINDYAVSKVSMEYMASLWFDRLPIVITRPFNYTGVGQHEDFLVPKIVEHYKSGKQVIELGNIDIYRDISDVRNVAKIYSQLAVESNAGATVNICSGKTYSISDILGYMKNFSGYEIEVVSNPAYVRTNEIKKIVGSNDYLKSLVGDNPMYELPATLEWMYKHS
jgi:nucleoside-diphosphate-sugar epimerase